MDTITRLPSTEFTKQPYRADRNDCKPKCNPTAVWVSLIAVVIFILIIILLFGSHSHDTFISKETLDSMRYADCPKGYNLSGDQCFPDQNGDIRQTCPNGGTPLNEGVCRIRKKATCPDGYDNLGGIHCANPLNNHILPISNATCLEGEIQEGGFCTKKYEGTCPQYYINSGAGVNACVHEFPKIEPSCKPGETLNDGRCYTSSVETFVRANEIEAKALATLNISQ